MIFKVNLFLKISTTSITIMLLFSFMNRCNMIFQLKKIIKSSTTIVTLMLLFPFMNRCNMIFQWSVICKSKHLLHVYRQSMWFRKQVLHVSYICRPPWTDVKWLGKGPRVASASWPAYGDLQPFTGAGKLCGCSVFVSKYVRR